MKRIPNPLIEDIVSDVDLMILSYINEYFSRDTHNREFVFCYFLKLLRKAGVDLYNDLENKFLINFFISNILSRSNVGEEFKKELRRLSYFEPQNISKYDTYCREMLVYIVENEYEVCANLIYEITKKNYDSDLLEEYLTLLVDDDCGILQYAKIDKNIKSRIDEYVEEFFQHLYIKSDDLVELYTYLQEHIQQDDKINRINEVCKYDSDNVLASVIVDKIIIVLIKLKQFEEDEVVLLLICKKIEELKHNRAQEITSGKSLDKMSSIRHEVEIRPEFIELAKEATVDLVNLVHMSLIPKYKEVPISQLSMIASYSSIDIGTGLTIENVIDNAAKTYFENSSSITINLHYLEMYKSMCQLALQIFIKSTMINNDIDKLDGMIVDCINDCMNIKLNEYFVFSMAGCLFLINQLENKILRIHETISDTKKEIFYVLVDLKENNYLTDDEFFYINYTIFDENGLNLRNNLAHGNVMFQKGKLIHFYSVFLCWILIMVCEERRDLNE
ncbi:hypothetical protein RZE82_02135 [Mollicutes bacterium LVI A0039]|nr:hypothetical protein RZE82_02135 [Mollicutes bacterium LVI A0039]